MTAVPSSEWIFSASLLGWLFLFEQLQLCTVIHLLPNWTLYTRGRSNFIKSNFWSAFWSATVPVTIFITHWIKFKISSMCVVFSWLLSSPSVHHAFFCWHYKSLSNPVKGPICIDCTQLSLWGGSVKWINPHRWPDGHSSHVDNLFTSKYCLLSSLIFRNLHEAERIQLTPHTQTHKYELYLHSRRWID